MDGRGAREEQSKEENGTRKKHFLLQRRNRECAFIRVMFCRACNFAFLLSSPFFGRGDGGIVTWGPEGRKARQKNRYRFGKNN